MRGRGYKYGVEYLARRLVGDREPLGPPRPEMGDDECCGELVDDADATDVADASRTGGVSLKAGGVWKSGVRFLRGSGEGDGWPFFFSDEKYLLDEADEEVQRPERWVEHSEAVCSPVAHAVSSRLGRSPNLDVPADTVDG